MYKEDQQINDLIQDISVLKEDIKIIVDTINIFNLNNILELKRPLKNE